MSLLILRRDCGAVYPLGVVVNLVGAARRRERLNTHVRVRRRIRSWPPTGDSRQSAISPQSFRRRPLL